jgi:hypothetical protein
MTRQTLCAALLALCIGTPGFGQAGDPSFPKETPPAEPEKKPATPASPSTPKDKPKPGAPQPGKPGEGPPPSPGSPGSDPGAPGAGTVDLRPRFRAGDETRYVMRIKSDNVVNLEGLVPVIEPERKADPKDEKDGTKQYMEEEIGFVLKVTSVSSDEGATVELIQERIKLTLKHGEDEFFYDSTAPRRPNDDSDLIEPFMKGVVGKKLTIRFDATGNIRDIQGGGELALPGAMGQLGIPADAKSIGALFGPISTRTSGRGLYRIGERWTNSDQIDTGPMGSFRMVTQHTLRSARAGAAEVVFDGRIEAGSESGKPGSGFQVRDSHYKGKYTWDTERGQLKSLQSDQEIEIGAGPANGAQGKPGGMKAKTSVTVERETTTRR